MMDLAVAGGCFKMTWGKIRSDDLWLLLGRAVYNKRKSASRRSKQWATL